MGSNSIKLLGNRSDAYVALSRDSLSVSGGDGGRGKGGDGDGGEGRDGGRGEGGDGDAGEGGDRDRGERGDRDRVSAKHDLAIGVSVRLLAVRSQE